MLAALRAAIKFACEGRGLQVTSELLNVVEKSDLSRRYALQIWTFSTERVEELLRLRAHQEALLRRSAAISNTHRGSCGRRPTVSPTYREFSTPFIAKPSGWAPCAAG